jgi:beta-mannosidase
LRRSFADRLLVFEPRLDDGGVGLDVDLVLINDAATAWDTTVTFHCVADGAVDTAAELTASVAPRASSRLAIPATCDTGDGLVVATAGALRAVHGPAGIDRQLATPRWATAVELAQRSVAVTVKADTVVRDLCLFADRIDPWTRVDEQLVTLLPGESHTFTVESRGAPKRAAWTGLGRPGGSVLRAIGDREPSVR